MSARTYAKMWVATAEDLRDLLLREKVNQKLEKEMNSFRAHSFIGTLYVRYVLLVNRLGDVFDQTLQVQKREVLKKLLESATIRMMELQKELKEIEFSEFVYLDNTLVEEKLIPQDIELIRPFYYPLKRTKEIQDMIDGVRLVKKKEKEISDEELDEEALKALKRQKMLEMLSLDVEEVKEIDPRIAAVNLIKIHELARQSRVFFNNMRMHPDLYMVKAPSDDNVTKYTFYHKPEQMPLIPIKRTIYRDNFAQVVRSFSGVTFYKKPTSKQEYRKRRSTAKTNIRFDMAQVEAGIKADKSQSMTSMERELVELEKKERNAAADKIQRYWLRYRIQKLVKIRKLADLNTLGMVNYYKRDYATKQELYDRRDAKRMKKEEFERKFIEVCEDEKARILKVRAPWIMEDISDHIRNWFREMYDAGGEFDSYPPEAKKGTILVLRGVTPSPREFVDVIKERELEKLKSPAQKSKEKEARAQLKKKLKQEKKEQKQKEKAKELARKALKQKEGKSWEFYEKEFITKNYLNLEKTMKKFDDDWIFIDELSNETEAPYMDWISQDKFCEVHQELRIIVDEFMRLEYERLKKALALDLKKTYKPPKPVKQKKKKKDKKGKKNNIEFKGTTVEEVYDDFKDAGVIHDYPKKRLDDYIGDISLNAYELRNYFQLNPMYMMGDVKTVLRGWIYGMGEIKMPKARSILIAGPPGCGKKFLAYALMDEMGAALMDLSPKIFAQYEENAPEVIERILKMAKILAPTVLFIDGAHYPFIKKLLPEDPMYNYKPQLIGEFLAKLVKGITADQRIMLIGTTNEPWNSQMGKMKKTFERVILCPSSDYGSTLMTWERGLWNKNGVNRDMNLSALSRVTKYYGTKQILDNCDNVVNIQRRIRLHIKPLDGMELLNGLLDQELPNCFALPEKTRDKYFKWFSKINVLAKNRASMMVKIEKARALEAKKA